jgi:hypothetical protein
MAGMDLSLRRKDQGISVFWMILATGALVGLLIAVAVVLSDGTQQVQDVSIGEEGTVIGVGDTPGTEAEQDRATATQHAGFESPGPEATIQGQMSEPVPADLVVRPRDITPVDPLGGFGDEPAGPTEPFYPTPSGPAGADGDPLTMD